MNYLKKEFYQILKSDENFFDFIQLNAFDGLWFWNLENSTDKWINPKFCNLLGYEYEELQGNQIQKIVHQDDQTKMQAIFDKYIKNDQSVHEDEIRFVHKEGKTVWLKLKALVFDKKKSKKHRVVVTHTDITKQHKLENALDRYESMLDNHSIFIIRTDIHGNYSYINEYFCERLNLDREKIIGKSTLTAIIEKDKKKCIDAVHECLSNPKKSVFVQLRKPFFDKKTNQFTDNFIYIDWEYRAILNNQGEIKEIQCVGVEVTEKVLAQQSLHTKAYELEASEEELRLNIEQLEESQSELLHTQKLLETCNEAARIGLWELNLADYTASWDKVIRDIHEVDDDFDTNSQDNSLFYKEGYNRDTIVRIFTDAVANGTPFDEQLQIITAKGNEVWVRTIGIPTFEHGKCIEMYGTFQDITTQKEAELKIKEKIKELETTQNELIHTQKLLDTSNKAAQIGTWELNLADSTLKWNKITKEIHEVDFSFIPTVENGINFYKEGYSRQIITRVFAKAVGEGIHFDEQLKIITAKGNEIWVRAIGIPTFENGKCVELYGTFQNIDKQKTNEINLQKKLGELEISQSKLLSTSKLLETCNASATIGTWTYNINTRDIIWDTIVHNIHELPKGVELDTLAKINFLKKGGSREKLIQVIKEAQDKGKPFDEELELISFRNNHKWVRVIGIPQTKNGRCIELYGTFQDITPQKQAELQLKEKVEELQQTKNDLLRTQKLLDTTNDIAQIGTWEIDLRTSNVKWNKVTKKIHEVDEDLVIDITKGIYYYKEGENRKRITEAFNNAVEKGIPYDEELRIITAKGNEVWVRTIGIPVIKNGIVVELYGAFHNINEQKNSELQLKQKIEELEVAQKEINKIQNQLSTTLEKTGVGLWELDLETGDTLWDTKSYKLFQETKESFSAQKWQEKIFPQDLKSITESIDDFQKGAIPSFNIEYRVIQKDSSIHYFNSKGVIIEENNTRKLFGTVQDITSKKLAELELKQKVHELEQAQQEIQKIQNKLTLILEKTGIGIWEIDLLKNQPYWDSQTKKMFGVQEDFDLNSESAAKRLNKDDLITVNQIIADLVAQKIPHYHMIYRTVPIEGKVHYHESKAILIKDSEENPVSVLGVTQDITKQKEYEKIIKEQNQDLANSEKELRKGIREMYHLQEELKTQKKQLKQIFDAVPAMIYQFKRDREGRVSFPLVSKGSELILGVSSEHILNNSSTEIFEAIHPKDLLGFQSSVQTSAATMQKWESELRIQKNGQNIWVHATSKPSHTEDGGIVWTGIMQNIDELKATELKIQEKNKQLGETLTELQETQSQLIHNEKMTTLGQLVASIAHEINTPLGAIHSSTESIQRMLTNTLSNLPNIIKILSTQQLEQFNGLVEKAVQSNDLYTSREKRRIKYDLIEELDTRSIPQSDRIADLLVDMGIHAETETYEPFIDLFDTVKILQAAYEISVIAKSNKTVRIATDKASKIITTLKNFSRQDHTGEKQLTKINESLENTLVLYHNKLKYGIEVIRDLEDLPLINAYEDELAQVWTNLLHNSIQAIEKRGKIYLTTRRKEKKILVSLRDTGKGIPDEVQQKIFDAFFTTKPVGEGSGLGLSIVRKIIEKHEGKIWFETENIGENTGTTFFVELPIQ